MKLTKDLLREMILKEMKMLNEGVMTPQNIEKHVAKMISDFERNRGAVQVAVISAENPPGGKPDMSNEAEGFYWDNGLMQWNLKQELDNLGYDYFKVLGEYDGLENSFMIVIKEQRDPGLKDKMIYLGKKYNQDAIVYGEKLSSMQQNPNKPQAQFNMVFEMILLHPTKTGKPNMDLVDYSIQDMRTKMYKGPDVQKRDKYFSQIGRTKTVIPFYSDEPADDPDLMINPFPVGE